MQAITARGITPGMVRLGAGAVVTGVEAIGAIITIITERLTGSMPTAGLPIRTGLPAEGPTPQVTAEAVVLPAALPPCRHIRRPAGDRLLRSAADAAQVADVRLKTCTEAAVAVRRETSAAPPPGAAKAAAP